MYGIFSIAITSKIENGAHATNTRTGEKMFYHNHSPGRLKLWEVWTLGFAPRVS
jgi:hypothetical protein